ncbi:alpha/beta fold hydrolase [Humibacillus xanthopallidus]|uniref:Pimeloyl-ACP methyl ester carboxylesterase n=1 Tax=Humibacillus xanthopallidus TaxID=412689 RepID=A0A543I2J5_9MICO|nr:alpha/beta hydrolase [Humibacillus xanthopallidus]TQM64690.1 pimeloyl-ACP methyl ester carboxylesterase [Humibacillus xanthopallidus]
MSIAHHVVGSGPRTVLLTHGWFGSADGWGLFVDDLDRDAARWVFTDVRGFGQRRGEEGDQSLDESARDLLAVADELGAARFTLVGHSMGGAVIQRVLALAPDRVEGLVGITPVGAMPTPFDDAGRGLFWGAAESRDNRFGIIDFTTGNRNTPVFVNRIVDWSLEHSDVDAFARVLDAWAGADFADEVRGSELPVLVVVGEHDPALGAETVTQTWLPLYPEARLEVLPNAGHYPMFETPVRLATLVNDFVADLPRA